MACVDELVIPKLRSFGVSHFQKRLKVGFSCVAGLWVFSGTYTAKILQILWGFVCLQVAARSSGHSSAPVFPFYYNFFLLWPLLASKAHFFLPLIGGDTRKTLLIFVNSMEEQMHCMYRLGPPNILGGTLASSRHSVHWARLIKFDK